MRNYSADFLALLFLGCAGASSDGSAASADFFFDAFFAAAGASSAAGTSEAASTAGAASAVFAFLLEAFFAFGAGAAA